MTLIWKQFVQRCLLAIMKHKKRSGVRDLSMELRSACGRQQEGAGLSAEIKSFGRNTGAELSFSLGLATASCQGPGIVHLTALPAEFQGFYRKQTTEQNSTFQFWQQYKKY